MRRWHAMLGCVLGLVPVLWSAEEPDTWRIDSEVPVEFDLQTGRMIATNGVVVQYRGAILSARRATLDQQTGDVQAEGDVRLEREGQLWTGERIQYNFNSGHMVGEEFKTGQPPFFAKGVAAVADQKAGVYVLADGYVTSDDYNPPSYRIQAKSIVVVPGHYVEARHATLRLGNTPVFYFPYFRRTLKKFGNRWSFTPGYRSEDGPFLLSTYHWYWDEKLDGAIHLDGRLKRGFGIGPDLNWNLGKSLGEGAVKGYYAADQDPGLDPRDMEIDQDRYRVWLGHQANPRTNLYIRGVLAYQSDPYILRDFFESEYRDNVQPNTFVEASQLWRNFSLDLLAQPRVNDFFDTVERLPDVKLSGFRQQLGPTPLYYESDTSVGWYQRKFAYDETNHFSAARADTFHQVTLPWTFFNWLNVTPRVGGRYTHYTEADGPGATTAEADRWLFNTGGEVSFKASRLWRGVSSKFWQVDGIRHIVQPSANYVYVPDPSPEPGRLPQFDYLVPTTRLLPLDYPDFNAVDAIDSQNVIRYALRNKLQTKRKGQIDNLLHWSLYMDWRLNPEAGQEDYSDVYSDMDLKPFAWLVLTSELRYDIDDSRWRELDHIITFRPGDRWSWSVGQRYLDENDPAFGPDSGHDLYFSTIYWRVNENWGLRMHHRFEANDGTMEEQSYSIYRDLRSWTSALTLRVRDERDGPTDVTVALTFSLKAFPRYGVGDDVNRPTLLLGN